MQTFDPFHNDPQQLDALLREAYLEQVEDTAFTEKLNEMTAEIIFEKMPLGSFSAARERELINKLSGKSGLIWWLNNWWWLTLAGFVTVIACLVVFNSNHNIPRQAMQGIAALNEKDTSKAVKEINVSMEQPDIAAKSIRQLSKPLKIDKLSEYVEEEHESRSNVFLVHENETEELVLPVDHYSWGIPEIQVNFGEVTDELPVLSEEDIRKVKKQKQKMISLSNGCPEGYVYVPMGTFHYNGNIISVQGFYMRQSEVTNWEYKTFLMDLLIQGRKEDYHKAKINSNQWEQIGLPILANEYFYDDKYKYHPVVNVSPEGAKLFCNWLTIELNKSLKAAGKPLVNDFRLPMHEEWAYAATGGSDSSLFGTGLKVIENSRGCFLANFKVLKQEQVEMGNGKQSTGFDADKIQSGKDKYCGKIDSTDYYLVKVYAFNPNQFKLYCMSGNAAEWVYSDTQSVRSMGGSWNTTGGWLKIEAEDPYSGVKNASPFIGFRPVMTAQKELR